MYEFLPELRRAPSDAYYHDDEDVEYDVFLYWPSRNELRQHSLVSVFDDTASETTEPESPTDESPTYTGDSAFSFPAAVDDVGISSMGYSKVFRTGLWAQSSCITRRLDAFIANAFAKLRAFRRRFSRSTSQMTA
ncbi:hypothetical protein C8Q73DRAFT_790915 [Cubamyces lactineus]|nr:hypothetical protein C8Q73DRAFT_790915 [Cubamyces lactineus]